MLSTTVVFPTISVNPKLVNYGELRNVLTIYILIGYMYEANAACN